MPPRFFICISFRMALSVSEFPVSTGRARRRRSINVCWVRGAHWCGVRTPRHVRRGSGAHRWRGSGHCFFPCQSFKLDCSFIKRGRSGQEIPRPGPSRIDFFLWQETPDRPRGVATYRVRRSSRALPPPPLLPTPQGEFLRGRRLRSREVTRFSQGHTANKGRSRDSNRFHSRTRAFPQCPAPSP